MYLKKLELFGFKSFAAKTSLEFNKGITAVVGPNGSGKSNVADALRWVLGEQSFKHIRTKKGEDLIFAGSPKKPQMGKAQVSIFFDNSDNFFPVDFEEVEITRKIFRDGTSEYILNNSQVRLKDIIEFLAAARLGVKGFNVVNQGAADAILNASPQEKREIIEEALGLREHQLKKADAQHRLEISVLNLDKVRALIAEIEPHLKYLGRSVKKFQTRTEIAEELKKAAKDYFSDIFLIFKKEKENTENQKKQAGEFFSQFKNELETLEKRLKEEESDLPDFFHKFSELDEKLRNLQQSKGTLERELGRVEGLIEAKREMRNEIQEYMPSENEPRINFLQIKENINNIWRQLRDLAKVESIEEIRKKINFIIGNLEKNFSEYLAVKKQIEKKEIKKERESEISPELLSQKEKLQTQLDILKKEMENIQMNIAELQKKERSEKEQFFNLKMQFDNKRREMFEMESKNGFWEIESEKMQLREADLKQKLAEAELVFEDLNTELSGGILKNDLEIKIIKLKRELGEIGAIDQEVMKEYEEVNQRFEFLTGQLSDLEKSIVSLNDLIRDLEEKIEKEFSLALININLEFNKYFKMMFGGGRAEIKSFSFVHRVKAVDLPEDDEDMTETEEGIQKERQIGLEIKVDMPRKHIRDIHTMSGGEKALTSIALVFGIIAVSPPPFIILDEIDAALDESNSQRFGKMVKELRQKTQFIVITHNRETMKQSDVLYGVTMEDGCSKLLSLKFEEGTV